MEGSGSKGVLKPLRHPRFWCFMWALAILAVIVISLMPPPPMPDIQDSDKIGHFLGYFILASCAVQLFRNWTGLLIAGACLVLLGMGIEVAQGSLTDNRMQDIMDGLANTAGVLVGVVSRLAPWRDLLLRLDGRREGA